MKIKFFATAVVWLFSGLLSSTQAQTNACGCADKQDLLNALRDSQMAIQLLKSELKLLEESESSSGKTEMYTPKDHKELLESLGQATAKDKGEVDVYGVLDMNPRDCSLIEGVAKSECVRQIAKSLVDVFKKACEEAKNLPFNENRYRQMRPLVYQYILAYQAMQNFALQALKSLPKNCRPNGWFGYVVYQKVQTDTTVFTYPPDPRGLGRNGGTATLASKQTYIGTVMVEGGKAVSVRAYASSSENKSSMSSQQMLCNTSDGIVTTVEASTSKMSSEGAAKGNVIFALNVNPANQTYELRAQQFPSVTTTGKKVRWSKSTYPGKATNCGGQESTDTQAFTTQISGPGHYVTDEKIKPGSSDNLEGNLVVKPPDSNLSFKEGVSSTTKTFEIQLRWQLMRLPAR